MAHPQPTRDFPTVMQEARAREAAGRIDEALQLYREAALLNPGHAAPDTRIAVLMARRLWGAPRPAVTPSTPDASPISMSTLGVNGRFGNQIFQYAYLRLYAEAAGAIPETGDWIGRDLFALADPLVSRALPTLAEESFDAAAQLAPGARPAAGVDLRGFFQQPMFAPHRARFRSLFPLCGRPRDLVDRCWEKMGGGRRPVVALHMRATDYGYRQFWLTPPRWYEDWLDACLKRWPDAVLYVATDAPAVPESFSRYRPLDARIAADLPAELKFVLDFFLLARADALAIANSSFSFAAALLNERATTLLRPDPAARELREFDPWQSPVLLDPPWRDPPAEPVDRAIIRKFIRPGATVFDIGARDGAWSRIVQEELLGRVRIVAFESEPRQAARLAEWAELTHTSATAVAGTPSIDAFCRAQGIAHVDFLRVSSAAAEAAVDQAMRCLVPDARVDFVLFSRDEGSAPARLRPDDMWSPLREHGYVVLEVSDDGTGFREVASRVDGGGNLDNARYLAVRAGLLG